MATGVVRRQGGERASGEPGCRGRQARGRVGGGGALDERTSSLAASSTCVPD
jgi:hypothetical protein